MKLITEKREAILLPCNNVPEISQSLTLFCENCTIAFMGTSTAQFEQFRHFEERQFTTVTLLYSSSSKDTIPDAN